MKSFTSSFFRNLFPKNNVRTIQQSRGQKGEDLAVAHIKKTTSFKILLRNWSNGRHEIDIICRDNDILVFIEVRARAHQALVPGYASIGTKKKKNLRKAGLSYLKTLKKRPHTYRFDVIELAMNGSTATSIRHHRNTQIF